MQLHRESATQDTSEANPLCAVCCLAVRVPRRRPLPANTLAACRAAACEATELGLVLSPGSMRVRMRIPCAHPGRPTWRSDGGGRCGQARLRYRNLPAPRCHPAGPLGALRDLRRPYFHARLAHGAQSRRAPWWRPRRAVSRSVRSGAPMVCSLAGQRNKWHAAARGAHPLPDPLSGVRPSSPRIAGILCARSTRRRRLRLHWCSSKTTQQKGQTGMKSDLTNGFL